MRSSWLVQNGTMTRTRSSVRQRGACLDGEEIGERIGDQRAEQRAERRQRQRVQERRAARRQVGIVVESEAGRIAAGRRALAEAVDQHHDERQDQEQKAKNSRRPAPHQQRGSVTEGCERARAPSPFGVSPVRARSVASLQSADLKRAMISARSGSVSVAAAPNSSAERSSCRRIEDRVLQHLLRHQRVASWNRCSDSRAPAPPWHSPPGRA